MTLQVVPVLFWTYQVWLLRYAVLSVPTSGDSEVRIVTLAAGYHSLRLAWRAGFFTVGRIKVQPA